MAPVTSPLPEGALSIVHPHAHIKGKLGGCSVHLASGHIYVEPGACLCIVPDVVPAPMQARLRLPFVEDDLQTAALVSNVILPDDDKIRRAAGYRNLPS